MLNLKKITDKSPFFSNSFIFYLFFQPLSITPSKTKLRGRCAQTPFTPRPARLPWLINAHSLAGNTELFVIIQRRPASGAAQSLTLLTTDPDVDVMDSSPPLPSIRGLHKAFQMEGLTSDSGYTHTALIVRARTHVHARTHTQIM